MARLVGSARGFVLVDLPFERGEARGFLVAFALELEHGRHGLVSLSARILEGCVFVLAFALELAELGRDLSSFELERRQDPGFFFLPLAQLFAASRFVDAPTLELLERLELLPAFPVEAGEAIEPVDAQRLEALHLLFSLVRVLVGLAHALQTALLFLLLLLAAALFVGEASRMLGLQLPQIFLELALLFDALRSSTARSSSELALVGFLFQTRGASFGGLLLMTCFRGHR